MNARGAAIYGFMGGAAERRDAGGIVLILSFWHAKRFESCFFVI